MHSVSTVSSVNINEQNSHSEGLLALSLLGVIILVALLVSVAFLFSKLKRILNKPSPGDSDHSSNEPSLF